MRTAPAVLLVLSCLAAAPGGLAAAGIEAGDNFHVTLRIAHRGAAGETSEQAIGAILRDGGNARLRSGWRLPLPLQRSAGGAEGDAERTKSYSYQSVGISANLSGSLDPDGRVRLRGTVESSAPHPPASGEALAGAGAPPRLAAFTADFDASFEDGLAAEVATAPAADGGTVRLIVTVQGGG